MIAAVPRIKTTPLEEVASIEFGTRVTRKRDAGALYPVYGGGGATFSIDRYNREDCYIVSRFAMSEECVRYVPGKFFLNDSGLSVTARDPGTLLQHYLDKFLLSKQQEIYSLGRGAAQRNLNVSAFKVLAVPIFSLDEQERIVSILDQAFAALDRARAHAEANLADTNQVFDAYLSSVIDVRSAPRSERHQLSEVFSIETGSTPPKKNEMLYGTDIPFIKPPELRGAVVGSALDGLSHLGGEKAKLAPSGSVLVSCIGNLGKVGLLDQTSAFNQQINAIFPSEQRCEPDFMYFQCRSQQFKDQLEMRAGGTTISIVNKKKFSTIEVWLPALDRQKEAVELLRAVEKKVCLLRNQYKQALANITNLRQTLLQQAFSGQLT